MQLEYRAIYLLCLCSPDDFGDGKLVSIDFSLTDITTNLNINVMLCGLF